jgi:hypothetical protein
VTEQSSLREALLRARRRDQELRDYVQRVLRREVAEVASTPQGLRHRRLVRAWYRLTRDGLPIDPRVARRELVAAAIAAGLPAADARRVCR